jgi:uncharacterized membrane protein YraQ (UPF0718 family)
MAAAWLVDVARSLREAFFMFWETLWPLILGFGLSGAIQAFASREALQRRLGGHGPAAVTRATGYGMVSSSCSYAASALAKSLVAKGADFVSAMVFMFASTNLVIELGLVLIVLMGWQFALSEFVGGVIMIVLLAALGGLWLRGRSVAAARQRLAATAGDGDGHGASHGQHAEPVQPLSRRLRSRAGWADAATYTMADLRMVARELVIGYAVAGLLAVLVPAAAWHALFLSGHGWWTSAENALVGPLVAVVSFVCSIGNVPLAAALWKGGIAFGGVISFLFADLITLPLLLVYRRYYGTRLMLRMLAVFWLVMSVAGLATEGIFRAAGLVPASRTIRAAAGQPAWNYTTWLNIAFLLVLAAGIWANRNRQRLGGGGSAGGPVCAMHGGEKQLPSRTASGTVEAAAEAAKAGRAGRDGKEGVQMIQATGQRMPPVPSARPRSSIRAPLRRTTPRQDAV